MVDGAFEESYEVEGFQGIYTKDQGQDQDSLDGDLFQQQRVFHENYNNCYKKETINPCRSRGLILIVPKGVKGNGWEALRKANSSVQDYSDQAGRVSNETFEDAQASKGIYRECRSYVEVVAEDGPRNGALLLVGK